MYRHASRDTRCGQNKTKGKKDNLFIVKSLKTIVHDGRRNFEKKRTKHQMNEEMFCVYSTCYLCYNVAYVASMPDAFTAHETHETENCNLFYVLIALRFNFKQFMRGAYKLQCVSVCFILVFPPSFLYVLYLHHIITLLDRHGAAHISSNVQACMCECVYSTLENICICVKL